MSSVTVAGQHQPTPAEAEFQERMKERMRQAMGDLMPDDVLARIVAEGIDEAFFRPRRTKDRYGLHEVESPSWMAEFLRAEMEKRAERAARDWFAANGEKVEAALREATAGGLCSAVFRAFDELTGEAMTRLRGELSDTFNRLRG
jgi:hypothetical protein